MIDKFSKIFKRTSEESNAQLQESGIQPQEGNTQEGSTQPQEGSNQTIKLQTVDDRVTARRNKSIIFIIGVIGFILITISIKDMLMPLLPFSAAKQKKQEEQKKIKLLDPPKGAKQGEIVDTTTLSEDWRTIIEKKIDELDKKYQQAEKEKEELKDALAKEKEKQKNAIKTEYPQKPLKDVVPPIPNNKDMVPTPTPPIPNQVTTGQGQQQKDKVVQPTFRSIDFKFDKPEAKKTSTSTSDTKKSTDTIDIPIGIAVGLTINGMDAPTFQWGQQDPQPLLTSIEEKMITAMGEEIDLRGCMVLSSAHGAVSAEKAMARLVKMNCRDKNGNLYIGNVKGWILGDDGKVGITGRLVSRQGSVLAKTFWADVLSLGGNYLRQSATSTSISPLGAVEALREDSDEQRLKSAAGQAIERTTGRIAQFFIKIAEQIYPVVEVMPGRKVTILFESGRLTKVTKDNFEEVTKVAQAQKDSNTERQSKEENK